MRRSPAPFLVVLTLFVACLYLGPDLPAFRTDAREYTLTATSTGYEGSIAYEYKNPTNGPVYLRNPACGRVSLEKQVNDGWVKAWSAVVLAAMCPVIVVGNEKVQGVVYPDFAVAPTPGRYRIVWDGVFRSYDDQTYTGDQLPLEQRVSNTFTMSTR